MTRSIGGLACRGTGGGVSAGGALTGLRELGTYGSFGAHVDLTFMPVSLHWLRSTGYARPEIQSFTGEICHLVG